MEQLKIVSRHQSGLWRNVDSPLFESNVKRMRTGPKRGPECSLISRSECTDQSTNKTLKLDFKGENWGVHHPRIMNRPIDCALEWDKDYWTAVDRGVRQLTKFRVTTTGGVLLLPSMMPWLVLHYELDTNVILLFSAAHNNLDNTPSRAAAWLDEAVNFRHWQAMKSAQLHRRFPRHRIVRIHQADVNKNIRELDERRQVQNRMLHNTGLQWGWNVDKLPAWGTHGPDIIDYCMTNMNSSTRRMAGDKFSDHDPIETLSKG